MNINFRQYTVDEFQTKFTNGKQFFHSDTEEVIIFRPEWDNSGLCFVEKLSGGAYNAHGCGIDKNNLTAADVFELITESKPKTVIDHDIKAFLSDNTSKRFTLSLRSTTRESLDDLVIRTFWVQKIYICPFGNLDLDSIEDGTLVGKWWENGKYTVELQNGISIYNGYDLAKMVEILCSEFK